MTVLLTLIQNPSGMEGPYYKVNNIIRYVLENTWKSILLKPITKICSSIQVRFMTNISLSRIFKNISFLPACTSVELSQI